MPKINHPRISPTEWQHHKKTIQKLYLSEDKSLMGEGGVIEIMKGKGFSASKPQYEAQFMRWGFKKKLTRENWHTIGHIIKNRDELGRVSYVYAYGARLPINKVKKETARYKTCDRNRECCTKQLLPAGIEVQSDNEEDEETILSPEAQELYSNNTSNTWPSVEPHTLEGPWNPAPVLDLFQPRDPQMFHSRLLADLPTPNTTDRTFQNALFWNTGLSGSYSQPSPFNSCDDVVRHSSLGISILKKTFSMPMNTIALFTDLNTPLFREFRALLKDNQPKIFASINQMRYLLPSEPNQLQKASVDLVILKQILYLLMNNFAGSDYAVFDTIFEQVRQFSVAHMEDMLNTLPHPYAAALQQSILTIAIKSNISILVEVILRRGLDSNRVTCYFGGEIFTPLGLACKFCHLEVVKVLLRAGADPNRSLRDDLRFNSISYLLSTKTGNSREASFPPVVCNILQQLLDHHARISWKVLDVHAFWKNEMLIDVLIHHNKFSINSESPSSEFDIKNVLNQIMKVKHQEKIPLIIQTILGNDSVLLNEGFVYKVWMAELLQNASYRGNLSLINYILERLGLIPDSTCLCEAIRGNQQLLVNKYL